MPRLRRVSCGVGCDGVIVPLGRAAGLRYLKLTVIDDVLIVSFKEL
jgi:hypothetical protein